MTRMDLHDQLGREMPERCRLQELQPVTGAVTLIVTTAL